MIIFLIEVCYSRRAKDCLLQQDAALLRQEFAHIYLSEGCSWWRQCGAVRHGVCVCVCLGDEEGGGDNPDIFFAERKVPVLTERLTWQHLPNIPLTYQLECLSKNKATASSSAATMTLSYRRRKKNHCACVWILNWCRFYWCWRGGGRGRGGEGEVKDCTGCYYFFSFFLHCYIMSWKCLSLFLSEGAKSLQVRRVSEEERPEAFCRLTNKECEQKMLSRQKVPIWNGVGGVGLFFFFSLEQHGRTDDVTVSAGGGFRVGGGAWTNPGFLQKRKRQIYVFQYFSFGAPFLFLPLMKLITAVLSNPSASGGGGSMSLKL